MPDIGPPPPIPIAELSVDPPAANFGAVVVGDLSAEQVFTISNIGDVGSITESVSFDPSGDFVVVDASCNDELLARGETCTISVNFRPQAEGAHIGTLTVSAGDLGAVAQLSGTGVGAESLSVFPPDADFGAVELLDASAPQTLTITNEGDVDAVDLAVHLGGASAAQFSVEADNCSEATLSAGEDCTITLSFRPTDAENLSAEVVFETASSSSATSAGLLGAGLQNARLVIAPAVRDFGSVTVGDSRELDFIVETLSDVESGAIAEAVVGPDTSDFAITASSCDGTIVSPGEDCTISVAFAPTGSTGPRTAGLEASASPGGEFVATLGGIAVAFGELTINPPAADFGAQALDTSSATRTFTIENTSAAATDLLSSAVRGTNVSDFLFAGSGDACDGVSLAAGTTCTVELEFHPSIAGDRSAALEVVDPTSGNLVVAALTGRGLGNARLESVPAGIDFGSVANDANSGVATVLIRNAGQVVAGLPDVALSGTDFSQFAIVQSSCAAALPPGASCEVTTRYSPVTLGAHSVQLEVSATPGGSTSTQLAGTSTSPAQLVFRAFDSSVAGGSILLGGNSGADTILIRNDGVETTSLISTTIVGPNANQFEILSEDCSTLVAGARCTLVGRFSPIGAPGSGGSKVAQLQVSAAPGGTILSQDWRGAALEQLVRTDVDPPSQSSAHSFGHVRVGATGADIVMTFTEQNGRGAQSSGALTVAMSGVDAADFDVVDDDCTTNSLAPGASCTVVVGFRPLGVPSARSASLVVGDAAASLAVVALSGTAATP